MNVAVPMSRLQSHLEGQGEGVPSVWRRKTGRRQLRGGKCTSRGQGHGEAQGQEGTSTEAEGFRTRERLPQRKESPTRLTKEALDLKGLSAWNKIGEPGS